MKLGVPVVFAAAGVAVAGVVAWRATRAAGAAADALGRGVSAVGAAVNPLSDQNIIYRGVNAVGGVVSGQADDFSLGTWLYNMTHGDVLAQPPATRGGGATGSWDALPADPFSVQGMPPYFGA